MDEKEKNRRINDLLYLKDAINYIITLEIKKCMRGNLSSNEEIKENIIYQIDEQLR